MVWPVFLASILFFVRAFCLSVCGSTTTKSTEPSRENEKSIFIKISMVKTQNKPGQHRNKMLHSQRCKWEINDLKTIFRFEMPCSFFAFRSVCICFFYFELLLIKSLCWLSISSWNFQLPLLSSSYNEYFVDFFARYLFVVHQNALASWLKLA